MSLIPEFKRIQDILTSFLGEPKHDASDDGQLQYNCPRCAERKGRNESGKFNLECNIVKQVFQCWSCCSEDSEMKGPLIKLITRYGGKELAKEYKSLIKEISESKYFDIDLYKVIFENNNGFSTNSDLSLPKTFTVISILEIIIELINLIIFFTSFLFF